jgi:hypothetical protein
MEIELRRLIGHRVIVMGRSVSRQGLRSANSYSRCSLSPMGYVDWSVSLKLNTGADQSIIFGVFL